MTPKQLTLDAALGKAGLARIERAHVESASGPWIRQAQEVAVELCAKSGSVNSDEVLAECVRRGIGLPPRSSATGIVFRRVNGHRWARVGVEPSSRPANNASMISRWAVADA
jgi:hypothetical protein